MPHIQYFDRTGRALSKREAFEADGKTMRDGVHCRVPAHLADHAPRFSDGRSFWDAHRDSLLVVDARRIGGSEGNKPGYRVLDNNLGRQAIADAYQQYEDELTSAWRDPPGLVDAKPPSDPDEDEDEENEDDDDERPQGKRVRPVTADRHTVDVDAMSANHRHDMQRLYDAHARELGEAWRK